MCTECGCGLPLPSKINGKTSRHTHEHSHGEHSHSHDHDHEHDHEHDHQHDHQHDHEHHCGHDHDHMHSHETPNLIDIHQSILGKNNLQAERNRGFFRGLGVLAMNVLSSPGSGKTTLLKHTIELLKGENKCGVVVGDLETDNDARRLRETGAPVVQISTGTLCHLDADMVARSLAEISPAELDILFIENVGNLVCPATFDLGEDLRLAILSTTEGEDKPLKYPPMFRFADVIIVSKMDLAQVCEFNREVALANLRQINPQAKIFELSSKTGAGMDEWCAYLRAERKAHKGKSLIGN